MTEVVVTTELRVPAYAVIFPTTLLEEPGAYVPGPDHGPSGP